MKLKFSSVALAATLFATSFAAQASIIGMADLTINQLLLRNTDTKAFLTPADVDIVGGSRSSSSQARVNGTQTGDTVNAGALAEANAAVSCVGACGDAALLAAYGGNINDNTTTRISSPILPTLNYALGDSRISGNALDGGAAGFTRADSQLVGPTNSSNANGNLLNEVAATVIFTAGSTQNVDFQVDYDAFVRTFIDAEHYGVAGGSSVIAGNTFTVTVFDETAGVDILFAGQKTWAPVDLNRSGSTNTAINGTEKTFASNGIVFSPSVTITGGHSYSVNFLQISSVTLRSVPEPGSMLLIGLGLAGLGAAARRRRVK